MPQSKPVKPAKLSLDFSNVEERRAGKKSVHVDEGDYLLEMRDYEVKTKKDDASRKYINWQAYILQPSQHAGKGPIYHVSSLVPENLWSLRNLLEDMGVAVPKKMVDLPMAKLLKRPFGATLEDDVYTSTDDNGNQKTTTKSKIAATFAASEFAGTNGVAADEDDEDSDEEAAVEAVTTDDDEDLEELDIDDI